MEFTNIKKELLDWHIKNAIEFENKLLNINVADFLGSWYYKQFSTETTLKALNVLDKNTTIPANLQAKILKKFIRIDTKKYNSDLEKVLRLENVEPFENATISVEWVKSATWGYNPHATVCSYGNNAFIVTKGSASGCGYDKQSAAISSAFNNNDLILSALYRHYENGGKFPYSVNNFKGLSSFNGGCGVECFYRVFETLGYTFKQTGAGKLFTCYEITKKEVQQ